MNNKNSEVLSRTDIEVSSPLTILEALEYKSKFQEGVYVAGGTLLQLGWEKSEFISKRIISLESLKELKNVEMHLEDQKQFVKIGALTTIDECINHALTIMYCPLFVTACKNIAAPAVRNRGTIGGNVASRIGDSLPVLLVLNAKVTFLINGKIVTKSLADWLNDQHDPSFLLIDIRIPCVKTKTSDFYKKVGRRETFTSAIVSVSGKWSSCENGNIRDMRLAVGGGNHDPVRLYRVEEILKKEGCEFSSELIYSEILNEFNSYSDVFLTDHYRKKVAANIIVSELKRQLVSG
ncbi:FAD binding domain-containing protein [Metabacillus litoralis]|uniref:FAD binding domain-containing protein n=1 Tax=Metabacillus litoralis TaxID=152268 RepID=UPI001CFCDED4|nr:FAD binding domain-containing protein [Metabacillus litoralis]